MVKLKALRCFKDLEADVYRKPGEVFEVKKERAEVIVSAGFAEVVVTTDDVDKTASGEKRRSKKG